MWCSPVACSGLAIARSASDVAADQRLLNPYVRRALGDGQGHVPRLATPTTHLVPPEVAGNVLDAIERPEQATGEHHILDELGDAPVADHAAVCSGERKIFEHGLAAERTARVDAELYVPDQVVERPGAVGDVCVGHPHDRRVTERERARVPGGALAHRGGGLARVEPTDEDALADERRVLRRRALVVEWQRAPEAGRGTVVPDVQDRLPEAAAEGHHL